MQPGQRLDYRAVHMQRPGLLLSKGFAQSAGKMHYVHFPLLNEGVAHRHLLIYLFYWVLCVQIPKSLGQAVGQLGRKFIHS